MLGERIKQLRSMHCWTLDEMAARMGGTITKQAISKYEKGKSRPSNQNLVRIAKLFNVKTVQLLAEPKYEMKFIAFRKSLTLSNKHQDYIKQCTKSQFENRLRVQELIIPKATHNVPIQKIEVSRFDDVERAADQIRLSWKLGKDEIANVTNVLENNLIHVMEVESNKKFDGMAVIAKQDNKVKGIGVVTRKGISGDRQKLNLAHELGHLVLRPSASLDEEEAAFRFGGAFLAPKEWVLREVGAKRTSLQLEELFILKKKTGLSIQAIIFRLKDLGIISKNYYSHCFKTISKMGWRKKEPQSIPAEENQWLKQNVLKAYSEGLLGIAEAENLLNEKLEERAPLSLQRVRSLMNLSLEERKRILHDQAVQIKEYYENNADSDWQSGDFIDE